MAAGSQRAAQRDATAERVPDDRDWFAGVRGDRLGDRGHVLELALDRIRVGVARRTATAPVDRVDREPAGEQRADHPERGVVGARAMDEQERRAVTGGEDRDRRAVGRS